MKRTNDSPGRCAPAIVLGTALLAGCGAGGLGQSRTGDDCSPGDADCVMSGLSAPLAVGASTTPTIRTELRGSGAPLLRLWSAAPSIMRVEQARIVGVAEGVSALVMAMDDGTAIDFVHVWVARPDRLEMHRVGPDGGDLGTVRGLVELVEGESLRVLPQPYAASHRLLGEGDTDWVVDPPIADLLQEGAPGRRRLLARAPGQATLTVSSLGLTSTVELVVHAREAAALAAVPLPPAPAADPSLGGQS